MTVRNPALMCFQIVSIHRYLMDPDFTTQTGLECDTETEVYDLIVTDFTNKMKCVLDPAINFLVQKGEVGRQHVKLC